MHTSPSSKIAITPSFKHRTGIYGIFCQINDRWYVGQARCLWDRRLAHLSQLRRGVHCNLHLQNIYLKYGSDSLEFLLLEELPSDIDDDTLLERENYWIDQFPRLNIINQVIPASYSYGSLVPEARQKRLINIRSTQSTPEYRHHQSMMAKAQWADPEVRVRNAAALAAKARTPEYRAKMAATHQRMWSDPEFRAKRMTLMLNTAHTPEARAKRSQKMRGKKYPARLTELTVCEIRRLAAEKSTSYSGLALIYGVSITTIKNIVNRKTHVRVRDLQHNSTVKTDHQQPTQPPTESHRSPDLPSSPAAGSQK